jgi:HK97 family phage major capsid protein
MSQEKRRLYEDALKQAQELAKRTDLNDEERVDLAKRTERIVAMREELKQAELIEQAMSELPQVDADDDTPAAKGTLGSQFVKSEAYAQAKRDGFRGNSAPFEFKAEPTVIDETTALPNLVVAERVNRIEPVSYHEARVPDLFTVIPTASNAVTYFTESSVTESIAPVAEGAEKPNFTLAGAQVTEEVEVIAGMGALTRQAIEDVPWLSGYVDSRMRRYLKREEENQLLNGNGTSPNLNGILSRTTSTQSQGTDVVADAIFKAADKCFEDGGYDADAVVIKPSDWQPIALLKDANERYIGGGPFAAAVGPTIWGMNVVKSREIAAGTVLVGAFRDAAFIARNGGLVLRTSDSHSDYFKKNKVAVLLEERLALGVEAPLAFCELTLA